MSHLGVFHFCRSWTAFPVQFQGFRQRKKESGSKQVYYRSWIFFNMGFQPQVASESIIIYSLMFLSDFEKIMKKNCQIPWYRDFPLRSAKSQIFSNLLAKFLRNYSTDHARLFFPIQPHFELQKPRRNFWNSYKSRIYFAFTDPRKMAIFGSISA